MNIFFISLLIIAFIKVSNASECTDKQVDTPIPVPETPELPIGTRIRRVSIAPKFSRVSEVIEDQRIHTKNVKIRALQELKEEDCEN